MANEERVSQETFLSQLKGSFHIHHRQKFPCYFERSDSGFGSPRFFLHVDPLSHDGSQSLRAFWTSFLLPL